MLYMVMLHLPVSVGEALDKLSILQIKQKYIQNPDKLVEIQKEIHAITPMVEQYVVQCRKQYELLLQVNERIWNLIDVARSNGTTDPIVMRENDARFRVKKKINILCNSTLHEQKNFEANGICIDVEEVDEETIQDIRKNSVYYDIVKVKYVGEPKRAWDSLSRLHNVFEDDPWIVIHEP
jgi:hypothetical protein